MKKRPFGIGGFVLRKVFLSFEKLELPCRSQLRRSLLYQRGVVSWHYKIKDLDVKKKPHPWNIKHLKKNYT